MAIENADSFDLYSTAAYMAQTWLTSGSPAPGATSTGRFGTSRAVTLAGQTCTLVGGSSQTKFATFAFKLNSASLAGLIMQFLDGSTVHMELRINSSGYLTACRNGTVLGTAAAPILAGVWYHVQYKVKIDDSTGTYEVRIDGSSSNPQGIAAGTGADTRNGGNATCDRILFNSSGGSFTTAIDDVILSNTAGALNNDWLGDCRIDPTLPSGAGNSTQFTPSAGSNYQNVDDATPDDDATYNESSTPGDKDTFAFANLTLTGNILAVVPVNIFRKSDAGSRSVCGVTRSAGADYDGATQVCGSGYKMTKDILEVDPATSAAWLLAGVNAAEFGYKVVT